MRHTGPRAATAAGSRLASLTPFQCLALGGVVAALGLLLAQGIFRTLPLARASERYRDASVPADVTTRVAVDMLRAGGTPDAEEVAYRMLDGRTHLLRADVERDETLVGRVETLARMRFDARPDASDPDQLPRLEARVIERLIHSRKLRVNRVRQDTRVVGQTLEGLIIVAPGAELVLKDVILVGTIISEAALSSGPISPFDPKGAPRLTIEGGLRIDSWSEVPGVAIAMPDGIVSTGDQDTRLQWHGDVIAYRVELHAEGSLFGRFATVEDAHLSPGLETIGVGRAPRRWSRALDLQGPSTAELVVDIPAARNWEDVTTILETQLP